MAHPDIEHFAEAGGIPVEPRSSIDKIEQLLAIVPHVVPDSEEDARLMQVAQAVLPHVQRFMPQDPERLDAILLAVAQHCLLARSDGAYVPATIAELLDPEPPAALELEAGEGEPT
jgi:hypothetical protein